MADVGRGRGESVVRGRGGGLDAGPVDGDGAAVVALVGVEDAGAEGGGGRWALVVEGRALLSARVVEVAHGGGWGRGVKGGGSGLCGLEVEGLDALAQTPRVRPRPLRVVNLEAVTRPDW